jgi:transcription elongation factor GreA
MTTRRRQADAPQQGETVTETTSNVPWLTQEAYDRLKAELELLSGPGRTDIARRIEAAREEGDLKENGGYHAAKEEQGKQEARIRQLEQLLREAKVGQAPPDDGVVEPGMVVTANVAGREMTFLLGSREVAEGTSLEVYSEKSPLGAAIHGKRAGDSVSYTAPNGKEIPVEVGTAHPFVA